MLYDKKWDTDAIGRGLLDAADHMEQRGWCKNFNEDKYGRVCLVGAIRLALGLKVMPDSDDRWLDLHQHISRVEKMLGEHVTAWNDNECTGKEHAIAMLKAAACSR